MHHPDECPACMAGDICTTSTAYSVRTVIMTIGCPGAGKTTWSNSLDRRQWVVLSMDELRIALFGSKEMYWNYIHPFHGEVGQDLIRELYYEALVKVMTCLPHNIVLANTNIRRDLAEHEIGLVKRYLGILPDLMVFEHTWEEIKRRNRCRLPNDRLSEDKLQKFYTNSYAPGAWWRGYGLNVMYHPSSTTPE